MAMKSEGSEQGDSSVVEDVTDFDDVVEHPLKINVPLITEKGFIGCCHHILYYNYLDLTIYAPPQTPQQPHSKALKTTWDIKSKCIAAL